LEDYISLFFSLPVTAYFLPLQSPPPPTNMDTKLLPKAYGTKVAEGGKTEKANFSVESKNLPSKLVNFIYMQDHHVLPSKAFRSFQMVVLSTRKTSIFFLQKR